MPSKKDEANVFGGWIQTFTGGKFFPLDPRADDVRLADIAHALALQTRYTGHCLRFYSVAEHCVHVSRSVHPDFALWGLLHDAEEAYLSDIARPVKHDKRFKAYKELGLNVQYAICDAFRIPRVEPDNVREIDRRMLATEKSQVMRPGTTYDEWSYHGESIEGVEIQFWLPEEAERRYLERFMEIQQDVESIRGLPVPRGLSGALL